MARKIVCILMCLVMATTVIPSPVIAAQQWVQNSSDGSTVITPFWTNTALARANISSSNTTVKPSAYIKAKSSFTDIEGTLYLEEKSGSSWEEVVSWEIGGTGTLTVAKSYKGVAGNTYRARVEVYVGGEYVECVSAECIA